MKRMIRSAAGLTFLFLFGCSTEDPQVQQLAQLRSPPGPAQAGSSAQPEAQDSLGSTWKQQKLIRDAEMTVEVESVERATTEVEAVARKHDGIIAGQEAWQDGAGNRQSSLRLRVPSGNFDAAMADLRDLGTVTREKISTEDVTKAYADLETRLSVKRTAEERLRAILSSRTGSLADILAAERELSRVTGEIEELLGEKKYYDQRAAISTILIGLRADNEVGPSIFAPVGDAFRSSLLTLSRSVALLIYVLVFLAPWLVLSIFLFLLAKRIRRRKGSVAST